MFPAEALPLVVVLSHLVHFALAVPVLVLATIGFALHGDIVMRPTMLLALPLMVVQTLFVAGIAMTVSSAAVLFRDLRDIITNLLTLGFFLTPILYTIESIHISRWLRALLRVNPMTPFVLSYQDVLFFGRLPGLADTVLMLLYALASAALGMTVFGRLRDTLAEAI
jgi:ABC-type polysaccharide/polyol phosphate export permease